MTLDLAKKNINYIINKIESLDEDITSRFYKLGIFPGVEVILRRKAPIFADPLLFEVEGSQIALTKDEAKLLEATEKQE